MFYNLWNTTVVHLCKHFSFRYDDCVVSILHSCNLRNIRKFFIFAFSHGGITLNSTTVETVFEYICDVEYRRRPYCQKLYFGLIGHFCRKFNALSLAYGMNLIGREEYGNFIIFCKVFCCPVEIYYWLLQRQCSRNRWSHIYRLILINFKCKDIIINQFGFIVIFRMFLCRSIIPVQRCNSWSTFITNKYQWREKSNQNTFFCTKVFSIFHITRWTLNWKTC